MRGFTLIEILLVIAIIGLLGYLIVPLTMDFYRFQQLDSTANGLVQALRSAHSKAILGELDSGFGVYTIKGQYTLFKGNSWNTRDVSYDQNFEVANNISFSGLNQVAFSKILGQPSQTGVIILTNGRDYLVIDINQAAVISLKSATQEIIALRPDSAGSECLLNYQTGCPVCPNHYQCVYEEIINDNNYASNYQSTSPLRDLYNIQNYSGTGSINYIEVNYRVWGGIYAWQYYGWVAPSIRTNNQTFDGPEINLSTYGTGQGLPMLNLIYRWPKNPATGIDWTWTDINNLQIGAKARALDANNWISLSQIYVKVSYLNF